MFHLLKHLKSNHLKPVLDHKFLVSLMFYLEKSNSAKEAYENSL